MRCSGRRHVELFRVCTIPIAEGDSIRTTLICKSCNCSTEDFTIDRGKNELSNSSSKRGKKSQGDNNAALHSDVRSDSARNT